MVISAQKRLEGGDRGLGVTGRCAECRDSYGDDCIKCTVCGTAPYELCPHCPPSLILGGD